MSFLHDFVSLIWPKRCPGCGEKLHQKDEELCVFCQFAIPKIDFHLEQDNPIAAIFWGKVNLHAAAVGYSFKKGGRIQHIIHALKYDGNSNIGIFMGELYGKRLKESSLFNDVDVIIPVPLHPKKEKIRGYNQSEMIAIGMAQSMNCTVDTTTLTRNIHTTSQTKKDRMERWENVSGIFKLSKVEALKGKHILIIDDVITTGATMEACIHALQSSEIEKISVAALAAPD